MKTASDTLKAFLRSNRQFTICDLYTISVPTVTWSGGALHVQYTDYRYSSTAYSVTYGGNVYTGADAIITRTKTRLTIGTEVDTLDLTVYADDTMMIGGIPFMQAVTRGSLDGARVRLDKGFINPTDLSIIGTVQMFSGRIAKADVSRSMAKISVNSDLELLNVAFPRNCYQAGCLNALYDGACGVSRSTYSASCTVSGATLSTISITGAAAEYAAGHWDLGVMIITSGDLSDTGRTIKSFSGGALTLTNPLSSVISPGTTLTLYAGCDKTMSTCAGRFSNLPNFRGLPYVPVPEVGL